MATEMKFGIEFPAEIKVGDYVQSTPNYENQFKKAFFGRVYRIDKRHGQGELFNIVLKNGDKQSYDEHWCRKVELSELKFVVKRNG